MSGASNDVACAVPTAYGIDGIVADIQLKILNMVSCEIKLIIEIIIIITIQNIQIFIKMIP